ncbi:MAG TPA: type II toxin-antitoxin system MqsA family antitoxin [Anaerolineales bacterium]|nr:type II toxin-antitoxin system MqsA family antitoxin [Anaerolineales bacterium]
MICLICRQAELVEGLTSISFERGEVRLVVNRVPARVCPNCDEAYVDEAVAAQLLQLAKKVYEAGILDEVIEYNHLP